MLFRSLAGLGYPPQRRALAAAGTVLNVAPALRRRGADWVVGRRARSPERRYAMFTAYVDRQVARAAAAERVDAPAGGGATPAGRP